MAKRVRAVSLNTPFSHADNLQRAQKGIVTFSLAISSVNIQIVCYTVSTIIKIPFKVAMVASRESSENKH